MIELALPMWIEQDACVTRGACASCRRADPAGEVWREHVRSKFAVPQETVDLNGFRMFACPLGMPPVAPAADGVEWPDPFTAEVLAHRPQLAYGLPGPGDLLEAMIKGLGFEADRSCSCEARKRQMNAWWIADHGNNPMTLLKLRAYVKKYRTQIEPWLEEEASKRGIAIDRKMKARALAAGMRAWWSINDQKRIAATLPPPSEGPSVRK
jgi:hypothetical protein